MSKFSHSNVDGLGHYHDPDPCDERLEEGLLDMTCESVTDDEIDEWLDNKDLPRTEENINKAVMEIAYDKLGWNK